MAHALLGARPMTRYFAALALALVPPTGCVSVVATVAESKPYAGVRLGTALLADGSSTLGGVPIWVALDLPLSALLDTLLLPYTSW